MGPWSRIGLVAETLRDQADPRDASEDEGKGTGIYDERL
jgi:hypothetical protein